MQHFNNINRFFALDFLLFSQVSFLYDLSSIMNHLNVNWKYIFID